MSAPETQTVRSTRSIARRLAPAAARVAVATVALSLSAGIAVPVGPVPFTLQILVLGFIVATMKPGEAISAVVAYLAIGAMGLPVFSGGIGGPARILGPSGGFLYGFVPAAVAGTLLRCALERTRLPQPAAIFSAVLASIAVAYFFGWAHLVLVGQMDAAAAFAVGCAPFIVPDLVKAGIATAAVSPLRALRRRRG